ncbi:MAG: sodium-dependent transporter, partial [Acidimicrobiales bacterium]
IIGRAGNAASAIRSVQDVSQRSNVSTNWSVLGMTGMVASFLIVSFYCVVAAWVVMYIPKFLFGGFDGMNAQAISDQFGSTISNPMGVFPYFTGFALLTIWLVSRGVGDGIELASKILMPLFFLLLIGLSLYSLYLGFSTTVTTEAGFESNGAAEALSFLFRPDFGAITPSVATAALGQAFFSIGLGSAIMITYGSYLPNDISIPRSAITVGLIDTGVALIAGLAIFPIVFANGLDVNSGAGLFFETLPVALSNAPLIGGAFFFLAIFAAVTSSISLLEPSVAWAIEKFNLSRPKAAILVGGLMWAIGLISVFSLAFMDFIDGSLTGAIMLPLTGLLTVLFVGWKMDKKMVDEQMAGVSSGLRAAMFFLVRYIAPVFVGIVLIAGIVDKFFS